MAGTIDWQASGALATVTLSNPARMNAMTRAMWRQLREVFSQISERTDLRCVLVQGGGAHFCAGGDISEYPTFRFDPAALMHFHEAEVWGGLQAMLDCPLPVLALVRGNCMGAGLEIASCCDLRLGAASSVYGAPIARLGFPMAPREAALVQQAVGPATAQAMLLAAERFDAAHMLQCGFLAWNTPDAMVQTQADALLRRMEGLSPQAAPPVPAAGAHVACGLCLCAKPATPRGRASVFRQAPAGFLTYTRMLWFVHCQLVCWRTG